MTDSTDDLVGRIINYVISGAVAIIGISSISDGPLNGSGDAILYLLILLVMWGYGYNTGRHLSQ